MKGINASLVTPLVDSSNISLKINWYKEQISVHFIECLSKFVCASEIPLMKENSNLQTYLSLITL